MHLNSPKTHFCWRRRQTQEEGFVYRSCEKNYVSARRQSALECSRDTLLIFINNVRGVLSIVHTAVTKTICFFLWHKELHVAKFY